MTDNITLPREAVEKIHEAWSSEVYPASTSTEWYDIMDALRAALAAEQPKHPGYIIGSHWLETAYSRICAGEAEEEVLRDCGWRRCAVGQGLTQHCAEAEALRRDAERYRWMTENHPEHETRSRVYSVTLLFNAYQKEHIDAAIDAAMGDKR